MGRQTIDPNNTRALLLAQSEQASAFPALPALSGAPRYLDCLSFYCYSSFSLLLHFFFF